MDSEVSEARQGGLLWDSLLLILSLRGGLPLLHHDGWNLHANGPGWDRGGDVNGDFRILHDTPGNNFASSSARIRSSTSSSNRRLPLELMRRNGGSGLGEINLPQCTLT